VQLLTNCVTPWLEATNATTFLLRNSRLDCQCHPRFARHSRSAVVWIVVILPDRFSAPGMMGHRRNHSARDRGYALDESLANSISILIRLGQIKQCCHLVRFS
jgi:hypothetical protein